MQVAMGKAHVVALTKEGEVFTFGMNNKGQCGRDFPTAGAGAAKGDFQLPTASSILASNVTAMEAPEDINSDHDLDTEHESSLSEVICPNGRHKWKHDQCMVCAVCGECTGYGSHCVSSGRPDRNPGMLCGCGSGDSGCAECGCCRTCAREDGDIAGGAAAAINSEKGRLRDRLIRMEYLAAETKERYLGPGESASEKYIRRRMQKMGNCRRSRRYTEKREGRRESELLKALESSMNKERNAVAMAALGAGSGSGGSNMPNPASSSDVEKESSGKLASLPPAKLDLGGLKIVKIATGLQHTLLLSKTGEVFAFGSNNNGQLGLLDFHPRGVPTQVKLPIKATSIACGSYHSVVLAEDGRVFTFGNYQKGSLGREGPSEDAAQATAGALSREEMAMRKLWFTFPEAIPGIGAEHGRIATWIGASADQTIVRVDETLINAKNLLRSTIMANKHHILILPTHNSDDSHFKSLAISRNDGFCRSFSSSDQATFNGTTVNLDPLYNVVWAYNNQTGMVSSLQPTIAAQTRNDIKETIITPELALPLVPKTKVSRYVLLGTVPQI